MPPATIVWTTITGTAAGRPVPLPRDADRILLRRCGSRGVKASAETVIASLIAQAHEEVRESTTNFIRVEKCSPCEGQHDLSFKASGHYAYLIGVRASLLGRNDMVQFPGMALRGLTLARRILKHAHGRILRGHSD